MKRLAEIALESTRAEVRGELSGVKIARASRVAFDDGGRVKYVAEVELEDGQTVGYSRADCSEFDAEELEAAMLGVIETTAKTERVK